jgi:hypothetical protein
LNLPDNDLPKIGKNLRDLDNFINVKKKKVPYLQKIINKQQCAYQKDSEIQMI